MAGPVHAQSTFGAILGMVRDATGAVIQNAQVTLQNTGTQTTLVAMVDESGNYAFRNVDVGSYKLTIAAPGFETAALPRLRWPHAKLGVSTQHCVPAPDPDRGGEGRRRAGDHDRCLEPG